MLYAYYLIGGFYWIHHCTSKHSTTNATWSFQSIILLSAESENVIDLKNRHKYRIAIDAARPQTHCWGPSLQKDICQTHFTGYLSPIAHHQKTPNWRTVQGPPLPLWIYKYVSVTEERFLHFDQLEVCSQQIHIQASVLTHGNLGERFVPCWTMCWHLIIAPLVHLQQGPQPDRSTYRPALDRSEVAKSAMGEIYHQHHGTWSWGKQSTTAPDVLKANSYSSLGRLWRILLQTNEL